MSTWATVFDVQSHYEKPIAEDLEGVLTAKLDAAEAIVRSRIGAIDDAITAERTTAEDVKLVLCNMVLRWLRNPTGVRTENVGPFGYTRDTGVAAGRLFLDPDDRRLLGMSTGAVTIQLADDARRYPTRRPGHPPWWVGNRYPPGFDPDLDC